MITLGQLGPFFYQRDLPNAMKVVGMLRLAGSCIVATYQERPHGYPWRIHPVVFYRFMGANYRLFPWDREDAPISDHLVGRLCDLSPNDKDAVTALQALIKRECDLSLNKRETKELSASFARAIQRPQEITDGRIQNILNLQFNSRYRLTDVDAALAERRAAA